MCVGFSANDESMLTVVVKRSIWNVRLTDVSPVFPPPLCRLFVMGSVFVLGACVIILQAGEMRDAPVERNVKW